MNDNDLLAIIVAIFVIITVWKLRNFIGYVLVIATSIICTVFLWAAIAAGHPLEQWWWLLLIGPLCLLGMILQIKDKLKKS